MNGGNILRRLEPSDVLEIKVLCSDCFPIEYTDHWFSYITSSKVFSLGCFSRDVYGKQHLLSMLVAEEQPLSQVESEVGRIVASASPQSTVVYVISLGVLSQHRKQGHGTLLINSLLAHVSSSPSCQAVYLHVQASNSAAQQFYNQVGFREFTAVSAYYTIQGRAEDAFLYCCYTNGSVAFPHTLASYLFRYYEEVRYCLVSSCNSVTKIARRLLNYRDFFIS